MFWWSVDLTCTYHHREQKRPRTSPLVLVQIHCVLFEVDPSDLKNPAVEEHVLLMVVNHVCTDGWSEKVRIAQSCLI